MGKGLKDSDYFWAVAPDRTAPVKASQVHRSNARYGPSFSLVRDSRTFARSGRPYDLG